MSSKPFDEDCFDVEEQSMSEEFMDNTNVDFDEWGC